MLFGSIDFAIFLPIVFAIYWFVVNKSLKLQNFFLLVASYVFYGWWDWRFLSLIALSTIIDFYLGLAISKQEDQKIRKRLLGVSLLFNLGLLGSLKYFNFFAESFQTMAAAIGFETDPVFLKVILPVGISFYTFQSLSYTIDVYRRKLEPAKSLIAFTAYVAFFPQLVAGPIERASNLLPQFYKPRSFDFEEAVDGCRQILWGLFKKIVVADGCAVFVKLVFDDVPSHSSYTLLLGAIAFAFQIYGDFSGYSDIALGTAKLFGFRLMTNFSYPYFSRDVAEFWRRWHISLSSWFRDYVYYPLGGSRVNKLLQIRNVFAVFLLSGLWHGANWTFICWGLYHALLFIPLILLNRNRQNMSIVAEHSMLPSLRELIEMGVTFFLVVIGWIIFRAETIGDAFEYLSRLFSFTMTSTAGVTTSYRVILLAAIVLIVDWIGRRKDCPLFVIKPFRPALRWTTYYAVILIIVYVIVNDLSPEQAFIYFQF